MRTSSFDEIRFGQTSEYLNVVEKAYGYKVFWIDKKIGKGELVMPFSKAGSVLISIPFLDYGGILANNLNEKEVEKECLKLLKKSGAKYMELRGAKSGQFKFLKERPLYQTAVKTLPPDTDELWKGINYEAQKAVKKSERDGVRVRWAKKNELQEEFYPMYLKWMKHFGSPSHPFKYFQELKSAFKDDFWLARAEKDNQVLAFLFGVVINKRVNLVSSPDNGIARESRVNDATHWFFMKEAVKKGLKYMDFGAVRYDGQKRFKTKWQVDLSPYSYWYYSDQSDFNVPRPADPDGGIYKYLRLVWRLLPDVFVDRLGPLIRKWLVV